MLPALTAMPRWVNAVSINVIRFGSLDPFEKLRKATVCFVMSVCPSAWSNSARPGRICLKFYLRVFFENLSRKFKIHSNRTRITVTLHEAQWTIMIIFP